MSIIENAFRHSKKLKIDGCEVEVKKTTVQITDSEIKQNFNENYGVKLVQDKKITSIQTTNKKYWKSIDDCLTTIKNLKSRKFRKWLPDKVTTKKHLKDWK